MKEYFVFKENEDIVMVDVVSKEKDPNVAIMDDHGHVRFFMDVKFGNFVEPIRLRQNNHPKLKVRHYIESIPTGGFTIKKIGSNDDGSEYNNEYSRTHLQIQMTERNKQHFLEFEDDECARLWIESMKNEYPDGRNW